MPNQIILAWSVDSAGTVRSPAQVAAALAAVSLYQNESADPVLGQLFGLTVETDATAVAGSVATRTLTLNMLKSSDTRSAPPPFPCHPGTAVPPTLPFVLRASEPLSGQFFVTNGSTTVTTEMRQDTKLPVGRTVQFASQPGVFYLVGAAGATTITLGSPFTGPTGSTNAFEEVAAPVPLDRAAVYSTSDLDTDGVALTPDAIPAGSGAQTGELTYLDSTGAGPFNAELTFTGRRPSLIGLDDPAGQDIAVILAFFLDDIGDFENSVGQITLCELSDELPAIRAQDEWEPQVDEAQMLIERHVAYLPPSYFALANPTAAQGDAPAPPTNAELAAPLAQFLETQTATPPPAFPLPPATVPTPTFLSGLFTRRIQMALAGVPIVSETITFA